MQSAELIISLFPKHVSFSWLATTNVIILNLWFLCSYYQIRESWFFHNFTNTNVLQFTTVCKNADTTGLPRNSIDEIRRIRMQNSRISRILFGIQGLFKDPTKFPLKFKDFSRISKIDMKFKDFEDFFQRCGNPVLISPTHFLCSHFSHFIRSGFQCGHQCIVFITYPEIL